MSVWIRRIGMVVVVVILGATLAGAGLYGLTELRLSRGYALKAEHLSIPDDSAAVTRGRHITVAISKCVECHGDDLGGRVLIEDPAIGRITASNLTRGVGGVGGTYTADDLARAIRHGIGADGKPLLFMPAQEYYSLSDADLGAVIAYLETVPPVDRTLPPSRVGPLARFLYVTGRWRELIPAELIDHHAPRPEPVHPGPTAEYGAYLARTGGCQGCHGMGLSGGPIPAAPPGFPPAANLTPAGIGSWTEADFIGAMRTGSRPDGSSIDSTMPWMYTAQMTDDELRALWLYLRAVPARETGRR